MTRALLIRNPIARHAMNELTLTEVMDVARAAGWEIDHVETGRPGHGIDLARAAAADGIDVVIVHGGDGTLNEAINGVVGTPTAVAVLRGGTANVWAKETGCPKDPVASMKVITTGSRRRVDLGCANGRYFLLMCGVGFDAAIVPRVNPWLKRHAGALSYILAGALTVLRTRAWSCETRIDGGDPERRLYWLLAGNTRSYGGVIDITYTAVADDGELDVAMMRLGGPLHIIADGVRLLFKRHARSPNIRYTRARAIEIATPGIPVQLDGESHGETPLRIEVAPAALNVVVPAGIASPLFSAGQP